MISLKNRRSLFGQNEYPIKFRIDKNDPFGGIPGFGISENFCYCISRFLRDQTPTKYNFNSHLSRCELSMVAEEVVIVEG